MCALLSASLFAFSSTNAVLPGLATNPDAFYRHPKKGKSHVWWGEGWGSLMFQNL